MHEPGIVLKANKTTPQKNKTKKIPTHKPKNNTPLPPANLLSKEGCQHGTYHGKDVFANVFF